MSFHKELPRYDSGGGSGKSKKSAARPRGTRAALFRNPLFHPLLPGIPRRFHFAEESNAFPVNPENRKNWQKGLKFEGRQHVIDVMAKLFPKINRGDTRVSRATIMEGSMYEAANSKQEYEMLLSLFQKAYGKNREESNVYDCLSNCSSESDTPDDSHLGKLGMRYLGVSDEEHSFFSDDNSNHSGDNESDN